MAYIHKKAFGNSPAYLLNFSKQLPSNMPKCQRDTAGLKLNDAKKNLGAEKVHFTIFCSSNEPVECNIPR
jgi:hypothetical protein